ncbi:MAG: tetrathionate reductase family octaheme c-type cytochrome [Candidatus Thiodiazotropha sp. (ex Ctena orbiculata)]|nr:tetrathionate reductase family octaheme c-type cytochrome [Candidatus Thiodiazotropha taylori]PUB88904.1 MAG: cytochrome C [gamma proteobacterium symbiont of Ctena orbiculata]MBT2996455.1 tetrathionate reductase family octaheme c-type cytochrome [Candidatus Thiodiazotropha taylori]MBT3000111.1 tetrathionate reductase family octaheme c-type cytochrome [Candidatus Thiodiazotropha taylori]MBV2106824.1 tetrathionate reductase family octaheme c-type cytochrome [Candidatus Thiodiazotropha taylori]
MHKRQKLGIRSSVLICATLLALGISNQPLASVEHPADGTTHDTDMNFRIVTDTSPSIRDDGESTADHSKFEILEGPFENGPQVTKACLSCHTEAGRHFKQSIHWTWEYDNPVTGQKLGKKHLINTFCTNARGNEGMCAQCHAGYGWKDENFDFDDENNIDCLVCHDRTGTYYRVPNSMGNKACAVMFQDREPIQWAKVAQNIGKPGRENCGSCHFYGGGGDGVKHGDLDSSLKFPDRHLDVHMDAEGLNFACTTCHVTKQHLWAGSRYNVMARDTEGLGLPGERRDVATCESCHSASPHANTELAGIKLNGHVDKIACQTCHIPSIARGGVATMVDWDWRSAGKTKNGEGYKEKNYTQGNGAHRATYKSIKGDFTYAEDLIPHYDWFDGQMLYTTIDSRFQPSDGPVEINGFKGAYDDGNSRIWPFKRMHTIQPYDKGNNTMVYMHLWGDDEDAYWGNYDFARAIRVGMEQHNIPYSGRYDFVETYSFWPITHMVAPSEEALDCVECHSRDGRLDQLEGFYLPGRDSFRWLDILGYLALGGALLGVLAHGLLRKLFADKHRQGEA